jgi:hypothetical protein
MANTHCGGSVVSPHNPVADLELLLPTMEESMVLYVTTPEKEQNSIRSISTERFLLKTNHFCHAEKLRTYKLHHCKQGPSDISAFRMPT